MQPIYQKNVLADICRRWQIAELSVFGSSLREDFRPDSDVDLLVRFKDHAPWSSFDLVELREELMALMGRPVDLVEEDAIRNPFRRRSILGNRQTIYAE